MKSSAKKTNRSIYVLIFALLLLNLGGLLAYLQLTELARYRPLVPTRPPLKLTEKPVYLFSLPLDKKTKLAQPLAVAVGKKGLIYVTDLASHSVKVFYPSGQPAFSFGQFGNEKGQFNYPYGITITSEWHVLVSDSVNGTLQEFSIRGDYLRTLLKPSPKLRPGLLYKDEQGKVYVSDLKQGRVLVLGSSGQLRYELGSPDNPLGFPQGIVRVGKNLWIADAGVNKIKIFTLENKAIKEVSPMGWSFTAIRGLSLDSLRRVFAADALTNRIGVFDQTGKFIFSLGEGASSSERFALPTGLANTQEGLIYITDRGSQRVQVWGYPK